MTDGAQRGLIYVLLNPHMPGVLKIGQTRRSSDERARELSRPTGVPASFEVIHDVVVSDALAAENEIHSALSHARVNAAREFFKGKHPWRHQNSTTGREEILRRRGSRSDRGRNPAHARSENAPMASPRIGVCEVCSVLRSLQSE